MTTTATADNTPLFRPYDLSVPDVSPWSLDAVEIATQASLWAKNMQSSSSDIYNDIVVQQEGEDRFTILQLNGIVGNYPRPVTVFAQVHRRNDSSVWECACWFSFAVTEENASLAMQVLRATQGLDFVCIASPVYGEMPETWMVRNAAGRTGWENVFFPLVHQYQQAAINYSHENTPPKA